MQRFLDIISNNNHGDVSPTQHTSNQDNCREIR